jgi:hypothetical protein
MDAANILQDYLDEVSKAVLADDWETYRDSICLPCHIISHDESKVISNEDDLKAGFDQFRDTLRAQRVTDYVRLVESAARLDKTLISGKYVSHLLAGGQRVMPPFKSQMTLRLVGNRWRAASVTNALANSRWPLVRLAVHPDEDPKGPQT